MDTSINTKLNYAMFSERGNKKVADIVTLASIMKFSWLQTLILLEVLAENEKYAEATDTAVQECVYMALGF